MVDSGRSLSFLRGCITAGLDGLLCVRRLERKYLWRKCIDGLPQTVRNYIKRLEELTGIPVDIVSTGPDRVEIIVLRHPFEG